MLGDTYLKLGLDALESDRSELWGEAQFTQEIGLTSPFSEAEEMELAAELMQITTEAELDQFLGKLIKGAWRGITKATSALRPLGNVLRTVAKTALPIAAGAAGTFFGGPVGTALGSTLGSVISQALETELEGLSPADRRFEMARRYVRLTGTAARQAALAQPDVNPQAAVQNAWLTAAQQQAAGLSNGKMVLTSRKPGGRWVRHGRTIILYGV